MDSLAAACTWLDRWRSPGRGTTIGLDGGITTWWTPEDGDAPGTRNLLSQLEADPDLAAGVKAIVHAEAAIRRTNH